MAAIVRGKTVSYARNFSEYVQRQSHLCVTPGRAGESSERNTPPRDLDQLIGRPIGAEQRRERVALSASLLDSNSPTSGGDAYDFLKTLIRFAAAGEKKMFAIVIGKGCEKETLMGWGENRGEDAD